MGYYHYYYYCYYYYYYYCLSSKGFRLRNGLQLHG